MMFDFPIRGTQVKVYQATFMEDNRFQYEAGHDGEVIAKLKWNRKLFRFE